MRSGTQSTDTHGHGVARKKAGIGSVFRIRSFLWEMVLATAMVAGICAAASLLLSQEKTGLLKRASDMTRDFSNVFSENTAHIIDDSDHTMLFMRNVYLHDPEHFTFDGWNDGARDPGGVTLQVGIDGSDGWLKATNLNQRITHGVNVSDREHFKVQRDATADELFISKPVRGRESGKWSIQLTRRIVKPDGSFDGIIVVSVDPSTLSRTYSSADTGSGGFVALVGADGVVRTATEQGYLPMNTDVSKTAFMQAIGGRSIGTATLTVDGESFVMGFSKLDRYGLTILVVKNVTDVLVPYYAHRNHVLVGAIFLSLASLVVCFLMGRGKLMLLIAQHSLSESKTDLDETLRNMDQGIMMIEADGRIPVINRRTAELIGVPPSFIGKDTTFDALVGYAGSDVPGLEDVLTAPVVFERSRPDGRVIEVRTAAGADGRTVRTLTDVTDHRQAQAMASYRALHDEVTELPNRTLLGERLSHATAQSVRDGKTYAVLLVHVSMSQASQGVWDRSGMDRLAKLVTQKLKANVRGVDTISRVGDMEFAILQAPDDVGDAAAQLCQRLVGILSEPFPAGEREVELCVKIGVTEKSTQEVTVDDVLKECSMALHEALASRKRISGHWFFTPEIARTIAARDELRRDLRRAIENDDLSVDFQPICEAGNGDICSYEALARWKHPVQGFVSPVVFVPLAEEMGLIVQMGESILKQSCRQAAQWNNDLYVTVNFSPTQMCEPDFARKVLAVLSHAGLPPSRLGLEVTETMEIEPDHRQHVRQELETLRAEGVRILLDDYGTANSTVSYLVNFPFDCIKIDRSFVSTMRTDPKSLIVIKNTVAMAKDLNLAVVAEGVETREERDMLVSLGVTRIQGYFYGKPCAVPLHRQRG